MKLLDTSAIIRSDLNFSGGNYFVTSSVLREILDENIKFIVNSAIKKGDVKIINPKEDSIREVIIAATKTGDVKTLSKTDTEILAAALEKNLTIVTDDYAIQNVSKKLNLNYETQVQEGIKQEIAWVNVCEGCGKKYNMEFRRPCEICGSAVRMSKKSLVGEGRHFLY